MDDDFEYQVRHRAYELWVAGGRPDGTHQQFWELAERELKTLHERSNGETLKPLYPEQPQEE